MSNNNRDVNPAISSALANTDNPVMAKRAVNIIAKIAIAIEATNAIFSLFLNFSIVPIVSLNYFFHKYTNKYYNLTA
jgi:hypothetical protein